MIFAMTNLCIENTITPSNILDKLLILRETKNPPPPHITDEDSWYKPLPQEKIDLLKKTGIDYEALDWLFCYILARADCLVIDISYGNEYILGFYCAIARFYKLPVIAIADNPILSTVTCMTSYANLEMILNNIKNT